MITHEYTKCSSFFEFLKSGLHKSIVGIVMRIEELENINYLVFSLQNEKM